MAPSSTTANNVPTNSASTIAMTMLTGPESALALLQASPSNGASNGSNAQPQIQGSSDSMPNANNMLVNGRGSNSAGSRSNSNRASSGSSGSASSPTMQQLPRPSSTARGNVAAFLTKLYNMVNDEGSNNLIKWSEDGQSFIVLRHVDFAKEVLPKFFKHNNFSSFVRQLNMYGFHKVPHLQQGVLLPDSDSEQWEFSNPHFQKNQPDLLCLVSRKKASNGNDDKDALTMDLGHILQEVTAIKKHQIAISSDLKNIERDHQSLWQESISARERHQRQQETIDKILRFLASVFSGEKKRAIVPNKKPRLTITEGDMDEEYETELGAGTGYGSDGEQELEEHEEHEEHEEEVTKLLGSKRKRASMVESEADYLLPGMEARASPKTKPTFNMSEMTPATLALLANANQSAQANPASSLSNSTPTPKTHLSTPASTASSSTGRTVPTISSATAILPEYLTSIPTSNYASTSQSFKLDPANLTIPTTFLPNAISPLHHDMLRSISMANAQGLTSTPLPPSFSQTPAGANVVKGVDDIAKEMEQLQRSIEALEAHGLNVDDFNFDNNYLNPNVFDASGYGDLSSISESGIPYQDPLANESDAMNDLIHTDQDGLDFITPTLGHQHLSSGQATPIVTTASGTPVVSSPVAMSGGATLTTLPNSPATVLSAVSSPATPASTVSTRSTVASTPTESTGVVISNPRTSTVGEEYLEDLLHLDA